MNRKALTNQEYKERKQKESKTMTKNQSETRTFTHHVMPCDMYGYI